MDWPLVSVIVPVFNGERFLAQALQSVITQMYQPIELIVVDDGSEDGSADIARSFPEAKYFYQTNQGAGAARNTGIAQAQGELFAFLDSDDYWTPDKLNLQVAQLLENPDIGYVLSYHQNFLEPGFSRPDWLRPELLNKSAPGVLPTLLVRRRVMDAVGWFNPQYRTGEDTDWFARAQDTRVSRMTLPETLLYRRIHARNLSNQAKHSNEELMRILQASIRRKKARSVI